eukprot:TRINITY_DN114254_c0_g1_i1.p1 TRINITY_DN114254_c0_g1~~TRINITY_DN114254_c0_g1_i1.p1  ORF type:complete len:435 (-),score=64.45 TRINITY_DN114254_c0_g1_i1:99-1403(-)
MNADEFNSVLRETAHRRKPGGGKTNDHAPRGTPLRRNNSSNQKSRPAFGGGKVGGKPIVHQSPGAPKWATDTASWCKRHERKGTKYFGYSQEDLLKETAKRRMKKGDIQKEDMDVEISITGKDLVQARTKRRRTDSRGAVHTYTASAGAGPFGAHAEASATGKLETSGKLGKAGLKGTAAAGAKAGLIATKDGVGVGADANAKVSAEAYAQEDATPFKAAAGAGVQAAAKATTKAVAGKNGLVADAKASAGVAASASASANGLLPNTRTKVGAEAGVKATAQAVGSVGLKNKAKVEAKAGPYAEVKANTKVGDRGEVRGGLSTGGPSAKLDVNANIDTENERVSFGGDLGLNLGIGANVGMTLNLDNPIDKSVRDGFTSGNAGEIAKSTAVCVNPTAWTSRAMGFKPRNTAEEVIQHVPVVGQVAAIGRAFKFW